MHTAIVFLPLIGAFIAGLFGRVIGARASEFITTGLLFVSAALSIMTFWDVAINHNALTIPLFTWFESGLFKAPWALRIDTLTAVMLVVVTVVSSLVHLYSVGYMHHDEHRPRFFSYLSLFTFAMLMLVTADNFVQLFFGWEGVGLASYLLIGFWYERPSANAAAIKAFVVNRVGDFGFALGIMAIFFIFKSVEFDTVFQAAPTVAGKTFHFLSWQVDTLTTICLLLFMGAMGKSAQLFLHTWLPDAMEGPTPVSALIHAATMVTAGVFLVCRCSPLFEHAPFALQVVTVIGASTAFFAATVGLVQNDIKRVIAYSTCSQLGYMFFAAGVSAYGAAMFHLFTHAFFKALLFLGAGSVIHAVSDEQDMRKMGGLYTLIPITWGLMAIGTLSLTGFPFTAGFFSKDAIIEHAWMAGSGVGFYAFVLGVGSAFLTSFYSWRLMFMTFHGPHKLSNEALKHVHESPNVMIGPLVVLAVGALIAGFAFKNYFIGKYEHKFWGDSIYVLEHPVGRHDVRRVEMGSLTAEESDHGDEVPAPARAASESDAGAHAEAEAHPPLLVAVAPTIMMFLGFGFAWFVYLRRPDVPAKTAAAFPTIYAFLLNKWYFDELYDAIFVRPARWLGRLFWKGGDQQIIDGLGPDGVSARVIDATKRFIRLQTGYVYHYAFAMLIGIALIITFFTYLSVKGGL